MQGHLSSMLLIRCGMSRVIAHQPHAVHLDQKRESKHMCQDVMLITLSPAGGQSCLFSWSPLQATCR